MACPWGCQRRRATVCRARHDAEPGCVISTLSAIVLSDLQLCRSNQDIASCTKALLKCIQGCAGMLQAEGGYVQGLGMMLSEDVKVDLTTGRLLSDSTWSYKVPSAGTKLPRQVC